MNTEYEKGDLRDHSREYQSRTDVYRNRFLIHNKFFVFSSLMIEKKLLVKTKRGTINNYTAVL